MRPLKLSIWFLIGVLTIGGSTVWAEEARYAPAPDAVEKALDHLRERLEIQTQSAESIAAVIWDHSPAHPALGVPATLVDGLSHPSVAHYIKYFRSAGEGRVWKTILKTGVRDFWSLADQRLLPEETLRYVPAVLAVMALAPHPASTEVSVEGAGSEGK